MDRCGLENGWVMWFSGNGWIGVVWRMDGRMD